MPPSPTLTIMLRAWTTHLQKRIILYELQMKAFLSCVMGIGSWLINQKIWLRWKIIKQDTQNLIIWIWS